MARRFTPTEEKELRDLLAAGGPLPIQDVRRILGLPQMPHAHLLGDDTWMLGGRVLRWLSGEMSGTRDSGDYDLYCGSFAAFERTARRMLESGYTPCRRKGPSSNWEWLRGLVLPRDEHARCSTPGDAAASVEELLLARRLPDGSELYMVQFHSPEGHLLQLVHQPGLFREGPWVRSQVDCTDLSICQFTLDGGHLHAGPHSWEDLLRRRVRVVHVTHPDRTPHRVLKYARRGFRPSLETVRAMCGMWLAERLRRRRRRRPGHVKAPD